MGYGWGGFSREAQREEAGQAHIPPSSLACCWTLSNFWVVSQHRVKLLVYTLLEKFGLAFSPPKNYCPVKLPSLGSQGADGSLNDLRKTQNDKGHRTTRLQIAPGPNTRYRMWVEDVSLLSQKHQVPNVFEFGMRVPCLPEMTAATSDYSIEPSAASTLCTVLYYLQHYTGSYYHLVMCGLVHAPYSTALYTVETQSFPHYASCGPLWKTVTGRWVERMESKQAGVSSYITVQLIRATKEI